MLKHFITAAICLFGNFAAPASAAELTPMETRWLQGAAPVLAYSRQQNLPIDIVVQPKAGPNDVPMAMGFDGKRCKLVLSLRGNPDAEAILASVPPDQQPLMIEVMAAHEIGHCWRYARGVWHALPSGFVDSESRAPVAAPAEAARAMREMRREEGFSDLVALAWTARAHPAQYAAVQGWLAALREGQALPRSGHDTMPWVRLARDPAVFQGDMTPFEAVDGLWAAGVLSEQMQGD